MNIGILFIATGRYIVFWYDFYQACEEFFLPNHHKTYFVFTDSSNIPFEDRANVKKIEQEKLGWPYDTLMRFAMFLKVEKELKKCDYLYFINGTMKPVGIIGEEIFPTPDQELMVTLHPGYYNRPRKKFSYETNKLSAAYIPQEQGQFYFMGGFNGGIARNFLQLCHEINKNITHDLQKNIVAQWHDESHLNKYMLDKKPLILSPEYAIPQVITFNRDNLLPLQNKAKMIIHDKRMAKYGGHRWLRGETEEKIQYLKIIELKGGLGNQLFQYAFGKSLAAEFSEEVLFDISWFDATENDTPRKYKLDAFATKVVLATPAQVKNCIAQKKGIGFKLLRSLRKIIGQSNKPKNNKVFQGTTIAFVDSLFDYRANAYYVGYFQSEKYFAKISADLRRDFVLKEKLNGANREMLQKIKNTNSVAVHFRRGDYVENCQTNAIHGVCLLSYYQEAIKYITAQVASPHFYFFSDDWAWVRANLKISAKHILVDINDSDRDYCDLELMRNCQHQIIANSSFSWWGAWLNENPHKIVVAPQKWLNDVDANVNDLLPLEWIRF